MAITMMSEPAEDNNATRTAMYNRLPPSLKRVVDEWVKRDKKSVDGALDTFYWQAKQIVAVEKDPGKYNKASSPPEHPDAKNAVEVMFAVLGIDNVRRIDFTQVGTHVTPDMVAKIKSHNETVKPGGITISKTHLIKLAAIGDDLLRDKVLDRAIDEGLSATRLQSEITRMLRVGEVDPTGGRAVQALRPTALVGSVYKRLTSLLEVSERLLSEEFTERVEDVKGKDLTTLNDRLAAVLEQLAKVSLVVNAAETRLTAAKVEASRRCAEEKSQESHGTGDPSPKEIQNRMNAAAASTTAKPVTRKVVVLRKVPNPAHAASSATPVAAKSATKRVPSQEG